MGENCLFIKLKNGRQKRQQGGTMTDYQSHGKHVFLDYNGYNYDEDNQGHWMLKVLQNAVSYANAREVHAHVSSFDGSVSPLGFAAVVLIDESHVTAHCYSERGWLAIDCFTCGESDPNIMADFIHERLNQTMPNIQLMQRQEVDRFLHGV